MRKIFFGNWFTGLYLAAVGAAAAATVLTGVGRPTNACVYLIGLTAPVSVIFAPIFLLGTGWMTVPMLVLSVLAGTLLNVLLINTIVGELGRVRAPRLGGALPVGQGAAGRLPAGRLVVGQTPQHVRVVGDQFAGLGLGVHVEEDHATDRRVLPPGGHHQAFLLQSVEIGKMGVASLVDLLERRDVRGDHQVHGWCSSHRRKPRPNRTISS